MRDDKTIITVSLTLEAKRNLDKLAAEYTNNNRSAWVQRAIETSAMVRYLAEIDHTGCKAHRKARIDGKCNPQLLPKCQICWEMNA
jgi:metal-responsive CopG/Arc/MetJ family transcriptional regulator